MFKDFDEKDWMIWGVAEKFIGGESPQVAHIAGCDVILSKGMVEIYSESPDDPDEPLTYQVPVSSDEYLMAYLIGSALAKAIEENKENGPVWMYMDILGLKGI